MIKSATAVIGAGRMGSVIARQLPPSTRKIIIDTELEKARGLADAVGGIGSDTLKIAAEADLVAHINRIASTEGIRAAVRVRHQLSEYKIPDEWIDVASRTVCAGILKAFVEDDLGDFARELVKEMQKRTVSERC